ncbi:hypothetical protein ACFO4L_01640 [Bacillus daqingensis]|uniref:Uncharacterized protein n=1 Tax=Bacillus daqingensis TaxID=872396 RepID=A0ABV9NS63_9BACI
MKTAAGAIGIVLLAGCALQEENQMQAYAEDTGESVYVLESDLFEKASMEVHPGSISETYEEVDGERKLDLQHGYGDLMADHFRMYLEDGIDVYADSPELSIVEKGSLIGRYYVNHADGHHSYHFIDKQMMADLTEENKGTRIAVSHMEEDEFWELVSSLEQADWTTE